MAARRTVGAVLMLSAALASAAGCDRAPAPQAASPAGPSTMPATRPTSGPATTQAVVVTTFLTIDDTLVEFPAARLRLDASDDGLVALLFSDDPPAALEEGYLGNSFYLQMPLDITDAKELASAQWIHRSTSSERDDTPFGLFMEGRRWHLQPDDVRADFEGEGSSTEVSLRGTFLLFDSQNPKTPSRRVLVSGTFPAPVQARTRKP